MSRHLRRQSGVSLIEAIVAMGVMAFGMLAVVGVQATLRASGDQSRQRSEALRIAQETLEAQRTFATIETDAGLFDFAEIANTPRAAIDFTGTALDGRVNTTFYRTINVPAPTGTSRVQSMTVTIDWAGRAGEYESVDLSSVISGVPPELAGSLAVTPAREPLAAPLGRHRSIPVIAKSLPGTGTSVFKPPQAGGGTVAWVFNNLSGLVTGVCAVDVASTTNSLVAADVAACSNNTSAQILSGYVRFANGNPTVDEAESPAGGTLNLDIDLTLTTVHPSPPVCFDDATDDPAVAAAMHEVTYYCLIYTNGAGTWAGRSRISPRAFSALPVWTIAAAGAANYKVCRYTPLAVDVGGRNIDHPLDYTAAGSPARGGLTNQNFLVIAANFTCPVESPVVGFFNSNTLLHQDGSVTYNTP